MVFFKTWITDFKIIIANTNDFKSFKSFKSKV